MEPANDSLLNEIKELKSNLFLLWSCELEVVLRSTTIKINMRILMCLKLVLNVTGFIQIPCIRSVPLP